MSLISIRRPVLVVAGALGAGKTTAVNATLGRLAGKRITVIENEAGTVGVDGALLTGAAAIVEIVSGCACCTMRGELIAALEALAETADSIDGVIIETSGLADPSAILQSLQTPTVRAHFRVAGFVCVVDAEAIVSVPQEALHMLDWRRGVRYADVVLLSKLDLLDPASRERARRLVETAAPSVHVVDGDRANVDLTVHLLGTGTRPPVSRPRAGSHVGPPRSVRRDAPPGGTPAAGRIRHVDPDRARHPRRR